MAYQAKRRTILTEEFELAEEDGTVVHTLHVKLDADSVVGKLAGKHLSLVRALADVQQVKNTSDEAEKAKGIEVLGQAVVDLLEAVFGPEDTAVITEFYDNRYLAMCQEVVPFITSVVLPKVQKIARENRKQILSEYDKRQRQFQRRL